MVAQSYSLDFHSRLVLDLPYYRYTSHGALTYIWDTSTYKASNTAWFSIPSPHYGYSLAFHNLNGTLQNSVQVFIKIR